MPTLQTRISKLIVAIFVVSALCLSVAAQARHNALAAEDRSLNISFSASAAPNSLGTIEAVPAATLLLPYFEVDLGNSNGANTVFNVHNASPGEVVAHVTAWTDLSVPTIDFDIHLQGHDSQVVDLRDAFVNGNLPVTGPGTFTACANVLPYNNPVITPAFREHLQAWHTGQPSPLNGDCAGDDHGDNLMRGYITVDVVNDCNLMFPNEASYYNGVIGYDNVLWGEYTFIDPSNSIAFADTLVHIEASESDPQTSTSGNYTFYGRYVNEDASDHREPLPFTWAVPFSNTVYTSTDLLVWRDSGSDQAAFSCGSTPSPYPLNQNSSTAYDESGTGTTISDNQFGLETQRTAIDSLQIPWDFGWLDLDLNTTTGGAFDPLKQSFVVSVQPPLSGAQGGFQSIHQTGVTSPTIGTIEAVPAATLLLPYFEVDLGSSSGVNTLFTVRNASPDEVVAHVTVWTDLSVPTMDFDIHLDGHDSQMVDLQDAFVNGNLPETGPGKFTACSSVLPYSNPAITLAFREHLQAWHTGQPSPVFGDCAGDDHADNIMRGYITIDVVNDCSVLFPNEASYYNSVIGYDNVLWGEYTFLDPTNNTAFADTLVHIEASESDPLTSTSGNYTFYGRYVNEDASDHREPLPLAWGLPFSNTVYASTDLLVWRDLGSDQAAFSCDSPPAALGHNDSAAYDQDGNVTAVPDNQIPLPAQRVPVSPTLTTSDSGWLQLDLNTNNGGAFDPFKQSFVVSVQTPLSDEKTGFPGVQLAPIDLANQEPIFGRAWHTMSENWLGSDVDSEFMPGGDINDGILRYPDEYWQPDNTVHLTAMITGSGFLAGWMDWNGDNDFNNVSELVISQTVTGGITQLTVTIPPTYTTGRTVQSRFRLYDTQPKTITSIGLGEGGEVEDYVWQFGPTSVGISSISAIANKPLPWSWLLILVFGSLIVLAWIRYRHSRR